MVAPFALGSVVGSARLSSTAGPDDALPYCDWSGRAVEEAIFCASALSSDVMGDASRNLSPGIRARTL